MCVFLFMKDPLVRSARVPMDCPGLFQGCHAACYWQDVHHPSPPPRSWSQLRGGKSQQQPGCHAYPVRLVGEASAISGNPSFLVHSCIIQS